MLNSSCYIFSANISLQCYGQVASIFTFLSDKSGKDLILKRLRYSEKNKLHVKNVVLKLQEATLYSKRKDA